MIYTYSGCCGAVAWERTCRLAEYVEDPSYSCPTCGKPLKRVLTAPRIFAKSFEPFRSPVDGSVITTQRELTEHNKRNNVVNIHEGYTEERLLAMKGDEFLPKQDPADLKNDMAKAVEKLEAGYTPVLKKEEDL